MKIKLSPQLFDYQLSAAVSDDSIILNGVSLDFSLLGESEVLPRSAIDSQWIAGDVTRVEGEINLTLVCPHGPTAPEETRFPAAFDHPMTIMNGAVPLPPYESFAEDPTT